MMKKSNGGLGEGEEGAGEEVGETESSATVTLASPDSVQCSEGSGSSDTKQTFPLR